MAQLCIAFSLLQNWLLEYFKFSLSKTYQDCKTAALFNNIKIIFFECFFVVLKDEVLEVSLVFNSNYVAIFAPFLLMFALVSYWKLFSWARGRSI